MNERQAALPNQGNKRMPWQAATLHESESNKLDCGVVNFALFSCAQVLSAQNHILPVSLSAGRFHYHYLLSYMKSDDIDTGVELTQKPYHRNQRVDSTTNSPNKMPSYISLKPAAHTPCL